MVEKPLNSQTFQVLEMVAKQHEMDRHLCESFYILMVSWTFFQSG